jgi:hypothetical protein
MYQDEKYFILRRIGREFDPEERYQKKKLRE